MLPGRMPPGTMAATSSRDGDRVRRRPQPTPFVGPFLGPAEVTLRDGALPLALVLRQTVGVAKGRCRPGCLYRRRRGDPGQGDSFGSPTTAVARRGRAGRANALHAPLAFGKSNIQCPGRELVSEGGLPPLSTGNDPVSGRSMVPPGDRGVRAHRRASVPGVRLAYSTEADARPVVRGQLDNHERLPLFRLSERRPVDAPIVRPQFSNAVTWADPRLERVDDASNRCH